MWLLARGQSMKARLIRIGNSRGVRLPKPMIEQARLSGDVDIEVRDQAIVITATQARRVGWAQAARKLRERDSDRLFDEPLPTEFDEKDWEWQ